MTLELLAASLPFSLRQAYPLFAAVSGGVGVVVVVYLIVARVLRRTRT
jgi:hypothetical protein